MPALHARGTELLVELLDAADQLDHMSREETRRLLLETAEVLGDLLKRDIPPPRPVVPYVAAQTSKTNRRRRIRPE
jgi:hypothetical protein